LRPENAISWVQRAGIFGRFDAIVEPGPATFLRPDQLAR
jgi:hypothetical protein